MSKESKPADLVSHLCNTRYDDSFCVGCGLFYAVNGEHRADCTKGKHEMLHPEWWDETRDW